jgi:L-iditol 2-dehydrogenase
MKALRLYSPGDLRVEDVEVPVIKENEALVQVMYCGVCGSDIPRLLKYGAYISPITPGHEFAGKIAQVGSGVKGFKVGDKVTVPPLMPCYKCEWCEKGIYSLCESYGYYGSRSDGAFAEYIAVIEENLLRVPDSVSYLDAASSDPAANALHGITQADLKEGDSLLVYGAGPIGLFAIQVAKARGASKVIAIDVGDKKTEVARAVGADVVLDALKDDLIDEVKKATGGEKADIVIDFTGVPAAQKMSFSLVRKMGKIVLLGISHQGLELEEKDVDEILRGQLTIIGSWNSFTKPFPGNDWFEALQLFEAKKMTAEPVVSHRLLLDEAPDTFKKIAAGGFFFNKIMFMPNGEVEE